MFHEPQKPIGGSVLTSHRGGGRSDFLATGAKHLGVVQEGKGRNVELCRTNTIPRGKQFDLLFWTGLLLIRSVFIPLTLVLLLTYWLFCSVLTRLFFHSYSFDKKIFY